MTSLTALRKILPYIHQLESKSNLKLISKDVTDIVEDEIEIRNIIFEDDYVSMPENDFVDKYAPSMYYVGTVYGRYPAKTSFFFLCNLPNDINYSSFKSLVEDMDLYPRNVASMKAVETIFIIIVERNLMDVFKLFVNRSFIECSDEDKYERVYNDFAAMKIPENLYMRIRFGEMIRNRRSNMIDFFIHKFSNRYISLLRYVIFYFNWNIRKDVTYSEYINDNIFTFNELLADIILYMGRDYNIFDGCRHIVSKELDDLIMYLDGEIGDQFLFPKTIFSDKIMLGYYAFLLSTPSKKADMALRFVKREGISLKLILPLVKLVRECSLIIESVNIILVIEDMLNKNNINWNVVEDIRRHVHQNEQNKNRLELFRKCLELIVSSNMAANYLVEILLDIIHKL
jgi:hypothetical protein